MDVRIRVGLATALALTPAFACEPALVSLPDRAREADVIFVGYVTGARYSEYESGVVAGEDPEIAPLWGERLVRVVPKEVLRGKPAPFVEVAVDCGSEVPGPFERVVVFGSRTGKWVAPAPRVEAETRQLLRDGL